MTANAPVIISDELCILIGEAEEEKSKLENEVVAQKDSVESLRNIVSKVRDLSIFSAQMTNSICTESQ